jgi:hypothetical protein
VAAAPDPGLDRFQFADDVAAAIHGQKPAPPAIADHTDAPVWARDPQLVAAAPALAAPAAASPAGRFIKDVAPSPVPDAPAAAPAAAIQGVPPSPVVGSDRDAAAPLSPLRPSKAAPNVPAGPATAADAASHDYAAIMRALDEYDREKSAAQPGNEARLDDLLEGLDRWVGKWLNANRRDLDSQNVARRQALEQLSDELAVERSYITKKQAHTIYLDSLAAGAWNPFDNKNWKKVDVPDTYQHKFEGATRQGRILGLQARQEFAVELESNAGLASELPYLKRMQKVKKRGLTAAEHAAILLFTGVAGADFEYINPATASEHPDDPETGKRAIDPDTGLPQASWLTSALANAHGKQWANVSEKTLREEGGLHAAMAISGLKKLKPFKGVTYRGESVATMSLRRGGTKTFPNLTSTSKATSTAIEFAGGNAQKNPGRKIGLLWALDHAASPLPPRDISALSNAQTEKEVVLFPGSRFKITSIEERQPGQEPEPFATDLKDPTIARWLNSNSQVYFITATAI